MTGTLRLTSESRIAIIGGGPAGALTAIHLRQFADRRGIQPQVTIYEPRDFNALGPPGCKGCAGVLSPVLLANLATIGLRVPDSVVLNRLAQYAVHSRFTRVSISRPEPDTEIFAVYRGGGPRRSQLEIQVSFDAWLLDQASAAGASVERRRVGGLRLAEIAEVQVDETRREYDLVILATGVGYRTFDISGVPYVRPGTQTVAAYEIDAGTEAAVRLGDTAHVLLIPREDMIFSALVAKGPFVNIVTLGSRQPTLPLGQIVGHPLAEGLLTKPYSLACRCRPMIPVTPARGYFADRFVAVGDAAAARLYKDGIGSAFLTARAAALTAVEHGIGGADFSRHYQPLCQNIAANNRWGRWLFALNARTQNSATFMLAQQKLISDEQADISGPRPFTRAAWGMFSGSYDYAEIARLVLAPRSFFKLSATVLVEASRRLFLRPRTERRLLHVGTRRILLLGCGFVGTSALRHLVRSLNRNEDIDITLVSEDNFFLFSPLLHEVAMGAIESRHIAYPIRSLHWRDRFNFRRARVVKIDLSEKRVETTGGVLNYDYLVIGLGVVTDLSGLCPVQGNATRVLTLGTLRSARQMRNHVIDIFERASGETDAARQHQYLTFIVSGGGYRGIQIVSELRDFIHGHLLRVYPQVDPANIRILLVEAEGLIAAEMDRKLGAYAMRQLTRRGIEIRLKSRVTRINDGVVDIGVGESIPAATLLWVAGQTVNPVIATTEAEKDSFGRIVVNPRMEVPGYPGVYAAGDCAGFTDPKTGKTARPLAHNGVRQAKVAAHNILSEIRGWDKRSFQYAENSEVVSLGAYRALFRFRGLRLYGFIGRMAWMAIYSLLVTGWYNRIRVVLDWSLSMVFGRDTTRIQPEQ